jgi:hypothetical protein
MDNNVISTFHRARAAAEAGHTERELVPVEVPSGKRGGGNGERAAEVAHRVYSWATRTAIHRPAAVPVPCLSRTLLPAARPPPTRTQ